MLGADSLGLPGIMSHLPLTVPPDDSPPPRTSRSMQRTVARRPHSPSLSPDACERQRRAAYIPPPGPCTHPAARSQQPAASLRPRRRRARVKAGAINTDPRRIGMRPYRHFLAGRAGIAKTRSIPPAAWIPQPAAMPKTLPGPRRRRARLHDAGTINTPSAFNEHRTRRSSPAALSTPAPAPAPNMLRNVRTRRSKVLQQARLGPPPSSQPTGSASAAAEDGLPAPEAWRHDASLPCPSRSMAPSGPPARVYAWAPAPPLSRPFLDMPSSALVPSARHVPRKRHVRCVRCVACQIARVDTSASNGNICLTVVSRAVCE